MPIGKSWMTLPYLCAQNHFLCLWVGGVEIPCSYVRKPAFRNPRAEHRAVRVRINDDKSTGEGHFPWLIFGNVLFEGFPGFPAQGGQISSIIKYIDFRKIHPWIYLSLSCLTELKVLYKYVYIRIRSSCSKPKK